MNIFLKEENEKFLLSLCTNLIHFGSNKGTKTNKSTIATIAPYVYVLYMFYDRFVLDIWLGFLSTNHKGSKYFLHFH